MKSICRSYSESAKTARVPKVSAHDSVVARYAAAGFQSSLNDRLLLLGWDFHDVHVRATVQSYRVAFSGPKHVAIVCVRDVTESGEVCMMLVLLLLLCR